MSLTRLPFWKFDWRKCQISPDAGKKNTEHGMLVGQCDAVSGTATCGDMLYSPGMCVKVDEFLKEFCKHLVKRVRSWPARWPSDTEKHLPLSKSLYAPAR